MSDQTNASNNSNQIPYVEETEAEKSRRLRLKKRKEKTLKQDQAQLSESMHVEDTKTYKQEKKRYDQNTEIYNVAKADYDKKLETYNKDLAKYEKEKKEAEEKYQKDLAVFKENFKQQHGITYESYLQDLENDKKIQDAADKKIQEAKDKKKEIEDAKAKALQENSTRYWADADLDGVYDGGLRAQGVGRSQFKLTQNKIAKKFNSKIDKVKTEIRIVSQRAELEKANLPRWVKTKASREWNPSSFTTTTMLALALRMISAKEAKNYQQKLSSMQNAKAAAIKANETYATNIGQYNQQIQNANFKVQQTSQSAPDPFVMQNPTPAFAERVKNIKPLETSVPVVTRKPLQKSTNRPTYTGVKFVEVKSPTITPIQIQEKVKKGKQPDMSLVSPLIAPKVLQFEVTTEDGKVRKFKEKEHAQTFIDRLEKPSQAMWTVTMDDGTVKQFKSKETAQKFIDTGIRPKMQEVEVQGPIQQAKPQQQFYTDALKKLDKMSEYKRTGNPTLDFAIDTVVGYPIGMLKSTVAGIASLDNLATQNIAPMIKPQRTVPVTIPDTGDSVVLPIAIEEKGVRMKDFNTEIVPDSKKYIKKYGGGEFVGGIASTYIPIAQGGYIAGKTALKIISKPIIKKITPTLVRTVVNAPTKTPVIKKVPMVIQARKTSNVMTTSEVIEITKPSRVSGTPTIKPKSFPIQTDPTYKPARIGSKPLFAQDTAVAGFEKIKIKLGSFDARMTRQGKVKPRLENDVGKAPSYAEDLFEGTQPVTPKGVPPIEVPKGSFVKQNLPLGSSDMIMDKLGRTRPKTENYATKSPSYAEDLFRGDKTIDLPGDKVKKPKPKPTDDIELITDKLGNKRPKLENDVGTSSFADDLFRGTKTVDLPGDGKKGIKLGPSRKDMERMALDQKVRPNLENDPKRLTPTEKFTKSIKPVGKQKFPKDDGSKKVIYGSGMQQVLKVKTIQKLDVRTKKINKVEKQLKSKMTPSTTKQSTKQSSQTVLVNKKSLLEKPKTKLKAKSKQESKVVPMTSISVESKLRSGEKSRIAQTVKSSQKERQVEKLKISQIPKLTQKPKVVQKLRTPQRPQPKTPTSLKPKFGTKLTPKLKTSLPNPKNPKAKLIGGPIIIPPVEKKKKIVKGKKKRSEDFLGSSTTDRIVGLFKRTDIITGDKKTAKQLVKDKKTGKTGKPRIW